MTVRKTAKGRQVDTPFSDEEALTIARTMDDSFVKSLLEKSNQYGGLTWDQMTWIHIKVCEFTGAAQAAEPAKVVSAKPILDMFAGAKAAGLKYPKILIAAGCRTLRLTLAGDRARFPGSVNVIDDVTRDWFGRIHIDGRLEIRNPSLDVSFTKEVIESALADFSENPAEVAGKYGRETGVCCFCSRELTDERSVHVGYGPVCADKFGLPWGEKDSSVGLGLFDAVANAEV